MQLLHLTCQHASLLTPPLQLACNVALAADAAACGAGARQKLGDVQVQLYVAVLAFSGNYACNWLWLCSCDVYHADHRVDHHHRIHCRRHFRRHDDECILMMMQMMNIIIMFIIIITIIYAPFFHRPEIAITATEANAAHAASATAPSFASAA